MHQKVSDKIESIENDLIQLKEKVEKNKEKKWFKNPSIIISSIALLASIAFSINSVRTQTADKANSKFNERVRYIEENIEKLLDDEKFFQTYFNNENISVEIKNNFDLLWNANSNLILDKISKKYYEDTTIIIDPNLLLQFGRNLNLTGRIELARDVFLKSLKQSKDYSTKLIAYRYLANIYAIPSTFQDIKKSREYHLYDIQTAKSNLHGEYAWESIAKSFELWANNEFIFFKNNKNGNSLIDSALHYSNLLNELNSKRQQGQDRLAAMRLFYNNGINKYFYKELWKVSLGNEENIFGEARINKNPNGIFIDIKLYKNNVLIIKYSGTGFFISNNEMSFDVTKIALVGGSGVLKIKLNNSNSAIGQYFQFGEKPVKLYLN